MAVEHLNISLRLIAADWNHRYGSELPWRISLLVEGS
jgi:hypothetical protein